MAVGNGHRPGGGFAPGHKFGKGRPPRNYSIATALSVAADEAESTDEHGKPLTAAQVAARWLWRIVVNGHDERMNPKTKERETLPVGTRDRLEALKTILSRIEPDYKLTPRDFRDEEAGESVNLQAVSEEELKQVEAVLTKVLAK